MPLPLSSPTTPPDALTESLDPVDNFINRVGKGPTIAAPILLSRFASRFLGMTFGLAARRGPLVASRLVAPLPTIAAGARSLSSVLQFLARAVRSFLRYALLPHRQINRFTDADNYILEKKCLDAKQIHKYEVARRKQTRLQRCTRSAHFPFFKTIDEFDFTLQSTLRESVIGSYLGLDFVTEGRSLILHGKTGRGKTHLAVAIGYRAIQNGFETLFTTAAELIEDLSNASKRGHLQESLTTYTHPHVLVIDEVGYLTYGPDAANVLFHVVNDRHLRKRPMIFTTNKPLNEWGKVLHDEDMAAAILDRVLERGRFIHLDGPSGRTVISTWKRPCQQVQTVPEFPELTARISGTHNINDGHSDQSIVVWR